MGEYQNIIFLLAACWMLQIGLAYLQQKNYHKILNSSQEQRKGYLGIGIQKAKFNLGSGIIMLVVTDEAGTILDCQQMTGYTVFARFRPLKKIIGQSPDMALATLKGTRKRRAFQQALTLINKEKQKMEES